MWFHGLREHRNTAIVSLKVDKEIITFQSGKYFVYLLIDEQCGTEVTNLEIVRRISSSSHLSGDSQRNTGYSTKQTRLTAMLENAFDFDRQLGSAGYWNMLTT